MTYPPLNYRGPGFRKIELPILIKFALTVIAFALLFELLTFIINLEIRW